MLAGEIVTNRGVQMRLVCLFATLVWTLASTNAGLAQDRLAEDGASLGPVVSAYLGYLANEQEVVDDRVSRREISRVYYRRNSNRIRALREMAIRIARETRNDYLPELEAVAGDELGTLFERPPNPNKLRVGEVLNYTLRYLGLVRSGEIFYLFARLDPYEQADLRGKGPVIPVGPQPAAKGTNSSVGRTRPRRLHNPR